MPGAYFDRHREVGARRKNCGAMYAAVKPTENPYSAAKKKRQFSAEDRRFFLFFLLFSFRSSLFSQIVVSK